MNSGKRGTISKTEVDGSFLIGMKSDDDGVQQQQVRFSIGISLLAFYLTLL